MTRCSPAIRFGRRCKRSLPPRIARRQTLRTAIDLGGQVETATRSTGHPTFTLPTPASAALERWRLHVQEDETRAARDRPEEVVAPWSGEWWSKLWVGGSTIVGTCRRSSDGVPISNAHRGSHRSAKSASAPDSDRTTFNNSSP